MPDQKAVALIDLESLGEATGSLKMALNTELFSEACSMTDNGAQWASEKTLSGAADAQPFSQDGCPNYRLKVQPYIRKVKRTLFLREGEGGLGFPPAEARRLSASVGSRIWISPTGSGRPHCYDRRPSNEAIP